MTEAGIVDGELMTWVHGEEKVTALVEFEQSMRERGIEIDWGKSRAYFDKPYDVEWANKVPPENRTVMNPEGATGIQLALSALKKGGRIVSVTEEGTRIEQNIPGEKVGQKSERIIEYRQFNPRELTYGQRLAGLTLSPVQWFWGDLASEWMMAGEIKWDYVKKSAGSFALLTGVGSTTEMGLRGVGNIAGVWGTAATGIKGVTRQTARRPFFYAGPEVRGNFVTHFGGMFAALLVLERSHTGQWNWEGALKGALLAGGIHTMLSTIIRGGVRFARVPKGWASVVTLPLEMVVAPPIEFALLKKWGIMEYRWAINTARKGAMYDIQYHRGKRREAREMALAAHLFGNEEDSARWLERALIHDEKMNAAWDQLIELAYAEAIGTEESEYLFDREALLKEHPIDFDPEKAAEIYCRRYTTTRGSIKDGGFDPNYYVTEEGLEQKKIAMLRHFETKLVENKRIVSEFDAQWKSRKAEIIAGLDGTYYDPDHARSIPALKIEDYAPPSKPRPLFSLLEMMNPNMPYRLNIPGFEAELKLRMASLDSEATEKYSRNPRELIAQRIRMEMDDLSDFFSVGGVIMLDG